MAEQVIRGDQDAALAIVEDGVARGMTGAVVDVQSPVRELQRIPVSERPRDVDSRAPGPKRARDRLQGRRHVLGDAVAQHDVAREVVLGLGLGREVLHERHRRVDGGHLGAGSLRHERDQPEVVDVLVGEDHELDVLERMAERRDAALEDVERRARVGTGVHERQRRVVDQVHVHAPDRERGGDREVMDTRLGGGRERVLAHGEDPTRTTLNHPPKGVRPLDEVCAILWA